MNKYLMMCAAALLGTTGSASAHCMMLTASGGSGPLMELHWQGPIYTAKYPPTSTSNIIGIGQGIAGWTKGLGKIVDLSDSHLQHSGSTFAQLNVAVSLPLRNGGAFSVYATYVGTGTKSSKVYQGTYHINGCGGARTPTSANVAALLAKLKAAKP